jgi:hypothetical protein
MVRCWGLKVAWVATRSRTSSSVTASRWTLGSAPASRTSASVERDSSHTAGRVNVVIRVRGRAARLAHGSGRCSAIRLGASSPTTRVR